MSTKNSNSAKKEIAVIDLTAILEKAQNVTVKEKNSLSRASLYKYSEEEIAAIKKDKDEGKKLRNKIRKQTDFYMSAILGKAKRKDADLTETIEAFKNFYSERFLRNDFTISSLREEKALDENSKTIFALSLEIVKLHL